LSERQSEAIARTDLRMNSYTPKELRVLPTVAATAFGLAAWFGDPVGAIAYPAQSAIDEPRAFFEGWLDSTYASVRANPIQLDILEQLFSIRNPGEVRQFLVGNPELLSLVIEASIVGRRFFGERPPVLDIAVDPESDRVGVTIFFGVSEEPDQALARLEQFDEAWWLDNMNRAAHLLSVSIEYS
jgi:hypothetical protein